MLERVASQTQRKEASPVHAWIFLQCSLLKQITAASLEVAWIKQAVACEIKYYSGDSSRTMGHGQD